VSVNPADIPSVLMFLQRPPAFRGVLIIPQEGNHEERRIQPHEPSSSPPHSGHGLFRQDSLGRCPRLDHQRVEGGDIRVLAIDPSPRGAFAAVESCRGSRSRACTPPKRTRCPRRGRLPETARGTGRPRGDLSRIGVPRKTQETSSVSPTTSRTSCLIVPRQEVQSCSEASLGSSFLF
jgi:hypothetical protein